jgi:dienelactone hydrolase
MAEALAGWGYVALFVDDFSTRGLKETCAVDFNEAAPDAYGALAIAASASADGPGFKTAVAFYPPCENEANAKLKIPTLVLAGANDDVTPAAACEQLTARQPGSAVKLVVYPGARHGFDNPEFGDRTRLLGMQLAYDRAAAERSRAELRDFLARRLSR